MVEKCNGQREPAGERMALRDVALPEEGYLIETERNGAGYSAKNIILYPSKSSQCRHN